MYVWQDQLRLVIPRSLRQQLLQAAHHGINGEHLNTKEMRRRLWYFDWRTIISAIHETVKNCPNCQKSEYKSS